MRLDFKFYVLTTLTTVGKGLYFLVAPFFADKKRTVLTLHPSLLALDVHGGQEKAVPISSLFLGNHSPKSKKQKPASSNDISCFILVNEITSDMGLSCLALFWEERTTYAQLKVPMRSKLVLNLVLILLPQTLKCWDYKYEPLLPYKTFFKVCNFLLDILTV